MISNDDDIYRWITNQWAIFRTKYNNGQYPDYCFQKRASKIWFGCSVKCPTQWTESVREDIVAVLWSKLLCNAMYCKALQCNAMCGSAILFKCNAALHNFPVQCGTMWPDFLCHGCLRQFPSPRPQELTANQNVPKCAINMSKRTKKHKHLRYTQIYKLSSILNLPNLPSEYVLLLFFLHLTNSQTNNHV